MSWSDASHKCIWCGEEVVLGKTGFLHGGSLSPDGHPSQVMANSIKAKHYADCCKKPPIPIARA